ncbi:MAG: PQQ-dependent sugar dehydrogenase [Nitrososphaerales archaeon]
MRIGLILLLFLLTLFLIPYPQESYAQEDYKIEIIAKKLKVPWDMVFAPDGRIFITEREGKVRLIENGKLKEEPMVELKVANIGEAGLLGIALHPKFQENHYVYLYYTYQALNELKNKVVRMVEKDNKLLNEELILDIPMSSNSAIHHGGRIKFGPDGKLYITVGEAGLGIQAQDLQTYAGKILRVNDDGSIPEDNPIKGSAIYTYGHRNPQGIDWHPITKRAYISEHGPSGFDPSTRQMRSRGYDEINLLEAGKNYGWPFYVGKEEDPNFLDPVIDSDGETWAPSGITFYKGKVNTFKDSLLVATLRGQHLRLIKLKAPNYDEVLEQKALFFGQFGRIRQVIEGFDGAIYLLTSNRDGRYPNPHPDDDRIIKIKPIYKEFRLVEEGKEFSISLFGNFTVKGFEFSKEMKYVKFVGSIESEENLEVNIPKELLGPPYELKLNNLNYAFNIRENYSHVVLDLKLPKGKSEIKIIGSTVIPEFPYPLLILFLSLLILILVLRFIRV